MRVADGRAQAELDSPNLERGNALMSAVSQLDLTELPLPLSKRINQICNRFEAAWKRGQRPRLEDFLEGVPEADRCNVLRELILLEIAYRKQAGDQFDSAEYRARFPTLDRDLLE